MQPEGVQARDAENRHFDEHQFLYYFRRFQPTKGLGHESRLMSHCFFGDDFPKSKDSCFFLASINLSLESLEEFKADSFLV